MLTLLVNLIHVNLFSLHLNILYPLVCGRSSLSVNTNMLFAGREVRIGKNCALGRRPMAVLKTKGTVFPNTDLPAGK